MWGIVATFSALAPVAAAQEGYPSSPLRMVVGFPPGGTVDVVSRLLAQKLTKQLSVNIFVDNKPGASGNIAAEVVAGARPDGYTVLVNTPAVVLSVAFGEKLGYDLMKDLTPTAMISSVPYLIVTHPSMPVNTPAEFISHIKTNPDKTSYGSGGTGSTTHLGPLLFLLANGLSAVHVPYKGGVPAMNDVVGGRIEFSLQSMPAVLPLAKDKRIKVIAMTGLTRSPLLSDVPTLAESVMPGFEISTWNGVMAPARTPATIIRRLNAEIVKALQDVDMKQRLEQESATASSSSPEEYGAYLRSELARWSKVVKTTGVKLE